LIIQQGSEGTAAAVDRVLRVWRYLGKAAAGTAAGATGCFSQLSDAAKDVLLAALVRRGKHSTALQLLQDSPASLRQLADLWSVPTPSTWKQYPVEPQLVQEALQICCQHGSEAAASSAALLWALLQQQAEQLGFAVSSMLTGKAAAQLVRLLGNQGQLAPAQEVYKQCLLPEGTAGKEQSAAALAQLAIAAAAVGMEAQHRSLLKVLIGCQHAGNILQAAVLQLKSVPQPDAAAVALLLHMPAGTSSACSNQHVVQLLGPEGLQQLCRLMVSTAGYRHSSGSDLLSLPSPLELAAYCQQLDSAAADKAQDTVVLQVPLVIDLLNAVAVCHPELQPAEAAAALGLVEATGAAPSRSQQQKKQSQQQQAMPAVAAVHPSHVVAQLCFQMTPQGGTAAGEVRDAAAVWVSQLSPEAAAAALFATWFWAQQEAAMAGSARQDGPGHSTADLSGLWLCLYARVRESGRPSVESLLPDLGLIAAAALAQTLAAGSSDSGQQEVQEEQELAWKEGEWLQTLNLKCGGRADNGRTWVQLVRILCADRVGCLGTVAACLCLGGNRECWLAMLHVKKCTPKSP
jgi:ABC-type transporter Mla MlaB component